MADKSYLRWPFFEDRHRALSDRLEAWAGTALAAPHHGDVDATCRALVTALGEAGFLAVAVPEAGAAALDVRSLCLVRETLARHSALADFAFAMQGLGTGSITLCGTDAQRARTLPAVRAGRAIAAFALSEPDAGSDVAALSLSATKVAGGWRLEGVKTWISNGGIADHYVVFARTGDGPGTKGISALIVPAATPGLEIAERIQVMAPHPLATLRFSDCIVPDDALLGRPGEGFKIAMATLDIFRPTVGAAALGMARRALDEALARARTRMIGGKPLADQQLIQAKLADMALQIDAAALLVYRAAWTRDIEQRRITREAAMAKLYATEMAQKVIDAAVQIFGGLGVKTGVKVEELYREIRALRIYEGASEVQQLIIARQTLQEMAP
ncbi:MAG: acyl-CoA dehydrogenase [Rhodospirillales bacterium]|nr:acyl-CoA dehydrogenase [Rhodospirillales bacterium]